MMKTFLIAIATLLTLPSALHAQKRVGDMIESVNNNLDQSRSPREMQYTPRDGGFFCINGKNRFTRALYGSNTDYRIETSDKPIFAIYKSKNYRNLRFYLSINGGKDVQLDSVEYCESVFKDGMRSYLLRDSHWGNTSITMEVVALPDAEGVVWHIVADDPTKSFTLKSRLCNIANPKLHRNGDMGADKPGCFEPSPTEDSLIESSVDFKGDAYANLDFMTLTLHKGDNFPHQLFQGARSTFYALTSRLSFITPDPWINTLGAALVHAADGCWDGETWLHGAIGWRMPLAGWRAGYLGDVLGWNDRAVSHFDAYAASQVTNQPVLYPGARQDTALFLARAEKKWGTEMYSNGYICRNPNKNNQMHHYDMNLNYIDELLWHFQYDADTAYMRKMWPVIQSHLAWEKMNFDSDNDHLYDAYCCIWASDALYYSDGAVTHSSAYNYRGNLLAAKIASLIGEDPSPYQTEADAIRKAMNERLWVEGDAAYVPNVRDISEGTTTQTPAHWAEYQESLGNKRLHPDAALWSVYTPIDCGVGTPQQMFDATRYVSLHIPHIDVAVKDAQSDYTLISTSDWMPYSWSINNVASAEIMHTALSLFEAGNSKAGYHLLKSNIMDQMYLGQSPGNFGQINYYDAARGECYRDFGDNVGISSRAIVQGLFGIVPQALDGKCIIRPGFPAEWDSVEVKTPYLSYKYKKVSSDRASLSVEQNFKRPLDIVVRINTADGNFHDYQGTDSLCQTFLVSIPSSSDIEEDAPAQSASSLSPASLGLVYPEMSGKQYVQDISSCFNASVSGIFEQQYLSPRPTSTSLQIPVQGVGEWCHPALKPEINDSIFRSTVVNGKVTLSGIPFASPANGNNIVFTSLWDNYPSSVTIPVKARKANTAFLLMAGSTNHMQTHLDNALVVAHYTDGTTDTLHVIPPFNYCPIEQDYYVDNMAFQTLDQRPLRVSFGTGKVSPHLGDAMNISPTEVYGRELKGGAGQILSMPLNPKKKVKSFQLTTLSRDVVVGLMAITLQ